MNSEMKDYVPFMDRYPELKLRPTTEFSNINKIAKYDYVQNLQLEGKDAPHGYFYLVVNDGLFGVYMLDRGFFSDTSSLALKPIYESIDIFYFSGRHFRAIVRKDGKYGMVFWTYGRIMNDKSEVSTIYDSLERIETHRFKAIKGNEIMYFDFSGRILK